MSNFTKKYHHHHHHHHHHILSTTVIKILYLPAYISLFKVNKENTIKMSEKCSNLTRKTPELLHTFCTVSIIGYEQVNMRSLI